MWESGRSFKRKNTRLFQRGCVFLEDTSKIFKKNLMFMRKFLFAQMEEKR